MGQNKSLTRTMSDEDIKEYEANVREAQRMAENSLTEPDKAAWLRIAQQWLRILVFSGAPKRLKPTNPAGQPLRMTIQNPPTKPLVCALSRSNS